MVVLESTSTTTNNAEDLVCLANDKVMSGKFKANAFGKHGEIYVSKVI